MVEHPAVNRNVVGSSPTCGAFFALPFARDTIAGPIDYQPTLASTHQLRAGGRNRVVNATARDMLYLHSDVARARQQLRLGDRRLPCGPDHFAVDRSADCV